MEFDSRAVAAAEQLNRCGYEAYLVGGCVRDFLRDVAPHDYDITTSARPEAIQKVFAHRPTVETGLKHGTVTVLLAGLPLEITTYRIDGDYADGRHPDKVEFSTSLTEDLARRDFTVNAMAWNPTEGLKDPFGGREDLENKLLRCVGDPQRRFTEDGLRILRGLRFAAVLGFSLEEATAQALTELAPRLKAVSAERIYEEFQKLICGKDAFSVLQRFPTVVGEFIPELLPCVGFDQHNFHHVYDVYTHLLHTLQNAPPDPAMRWAALLHDIGKPQTFSLDEKGVGHFYGHAQRSAELADEILKRLRADNNTRRQVNTLIRHHDFPIEADERILRRRLNKLGEEGLSRLIALMRADNLALAPEFRDRQTHYDALEEILHRILAEKQCFSLKDLAVDGRDLIALGYEGRQIGAALNTLLEQVLDGHCENEKEALLRTLRRQ